MKIAYLTYLGFPSNTAASINVVRGCQAMAELGHEVLLCAPRNHPAKLDSTVDIQDHYGIRPRFSIRELPSWSGPGGRHVYAWSCVRHLRRYRPDIVIGRYLRSILFAARAGFPVVYEIHSPIKKKRKDLEKLIRTGRLRLLVTLTEKLRRHFLEQHIPGLTEEKIMVLPSGRLPAHRNIRPVRLPKRTNGWNIGYTGKLQFQKVLALLARLTSELPEHDFHIVGGDAQSISYWREKMNTSNVHFHGYVPPGRLPAFIEAMDLCLLPNQPHPKNPEGTLYSSPMKAFDYMAQGKPVLASDFPEIREIFSEGTAVLLDPTDPRRWVRAIRTLKKDELLELGRRARARFLSNFTLSARYTKMLDRACSQKA